MREALLGRLRSWLTTCGESRQTVAVVVLCICVGVAGGALFGFLGPLLAVALVVAMSGGLLMLRSTQVVFFALIGIICLLPFAALPVPNVGFSPTVLGLILAVLLLSWLFQVARKKQKRLFGSVLGPPIVILMVLACVSFVIGLSFASLTTSLMRQFAELLLNLLLFFLVINNVRQQKHLEQVVMALILAGFAAAVIGIVLYFLPEDVTIRLLSMLRVFRYPSGSDVIVHVESNLELPIRATSTSINPNVLGGMLAIVGALALPQLLSRDPIPPFAIAGRRWGLNWLVLPVLGAMVSCLVLSYSRGAMVGLAAGISVVALLRYRKLLVLGLVAGAMLLALPQMQWYVGHFLEGIRGQDLATQMRFGEYKDALILISRYPWFGVGFSGAPQIDVYIGVSNMYLLVAEEIGLAGLATFLLTMALTLREEWRGLGQKGISGRRESILLGLIAALVAVLVTGIFDHYFFNINFQHAVALLWLIVALGIAATQLPVI